MLDRKNQADVSAIDLGWDIRSSNSKLITVRPETGTTTYTRRLAFLPCMPRHTITIGSYYGVPCKLPVYCVVRRLRSNFRHVFACKFNTSDTSIPLLRNSSPRQARLTFNHEWSNQRWLHSGELSLTEIAQAAGYKKSTLSRISSNIRMYGSVKAPPIKGGRPRKITPVMLEALCDYMIEKPALYLEEMVIFLSAKFIPDMSQLDTCLRQLSIVSKIPDQQGPVTG